MFYLRNLKKLFKQSPLLLAGYLFFALATPVICFNAGNFASVVNKVSKSAIQLPFFHALIDKKENYNRVSRKLRSLPGVKNVEVVAPEQMKEEAGKILGSLDFDISSELLELGHAGLKVVFDANLQQKSMDLVREYLVRLVGEDSITMGELVQADNDVESSGLKNFLNENIQWVIIGITLFFWLVFNFIFAKIFNNQLYLIQSFQRTKNIPVKIYSLIAFTLLITPAIIFILAGYNLIPIAYIALAFVVGIIPHLKKWQWNAR